MPTLTNSSDSELILQQTTQPSAKTRFPGGDAMQNKSYGGGRAHFSFEPP